MTTLTSPDNIPKLPSPGHGRPTLLTQNTQDIIVAAIEKGLYIESACALADVSKQTYYNWIERARKGEDPYIYLLDGIQKAEATHKERCLAHLEAAAKAGPQHWTAAAWQLERRYKAEYGQQMPAQQPVQQPAQQVVFVLPTGTRVRLDDISDKDIIAVPVEVLPEPPGTGLPGTEPEPG